MPKPVITARKRSLRRSCFHRCLSVYRGGLSLCPGGLCPGGSLSRGVFVQGGFCPGDLCPGGSLSRGSLSRQVSVWEGLCPEGVSVQGVSLSKGFSVHGGFFSVTETPLDDNERAVGILLECILVSFSF